MMNHRSQSLSAKIVVARIIVQFKWKNALSNLKLLPIVLISIVAKMAVTETKMEPIWLKQKFSQLIDHFVPIFGLASSFVVLVWVKFIHTFFLL